MRTILPDPCYFILAEEESKGGIIGVSVVVLGEYFVPFMIMEVDQEHWPGKRQRYIACRNETREFVFAILGGDNLHLSLSAAVMTSFADQIPTEMF